MNKYKIFALLAMMVALVCITVKADTDQHDYKFATHGMFANPHGGVTNIKQIRNNSAYAIRVWKTDGGAVQSETIPARGVFNGDFWIPWADNQDQYRNHYLTISVGVRVIAWIWQSGDYVRYNNANRFVNNAQLVPGVPCSGGNRRLVITQAAGGIWEFRFEGFE